MASIAGLTEEQNRALAGIQTGDLIWICWDPYYRNRENDEDEDITEPPSEDDDGDEGDDEDDNVQEEDTGAAGQVDVPDVTQTGEVGAADTEDEHGAMGSQSSVIDEDTYSACMYTVSALVKNTDGTVINARLTRLTYSPSLGNANNAHVYHIYGRSCVTFHASNCPSGGCTETDDIGDIVLDGDYDLKVNPTGDDMRCEEEFIRAARPLGRCVDICDQGWLNDTSTLSNMVRGFQPLVDPPDTLMPAVCPVCIGTDHLMCQTSLQRQLLDNGQIVLEPVIDFIGRVNARRRALGLRFRQLDEREWGYYFDDVEDEDDGDDDDDGGEDVWQHWTAAQDPNNEENIKTRPASDDAIKSLPRKVWATVEHPDGSGLESNECVICKDEFEKGDVLVQLPCGHAHFHETCITMWLKQFSNCPIDRQEISAPPDAKKAAPAHDTLGTKLEPSPKEESDEAEQEGMFQMDHEGDVQMGEADDL